MESRSARHRGLSMAARAAQALQLPAPTAIVTGMLSQSARRTHTMVADVCG